MDVSRRSAPSRYSGPYRYRHRGTSGRQIFMATVPRVIPIPIQNRTDTGSLKASIENTALFPFPLQNATDRKSPIG